MLLTKKGSTIDQWWWWWWEYGGSQTTRINKAPGIQRPTRTLPLLQPDTIHKPSLASRLGGIIPFPGDGSRGAERSRTAPRSPGQASRVRICSLYHAPVAHKGFPAITALRLLGSLTWFTDDKTETKKGDKTSLETQSPMSQSWAHPHLIPAGRNQQEFGQGRCQLGGESPGPDDHDQEPGWRGLEEVALRSLQGNTSRAGKPSSEPFPRGQVLVWAGQIGGPGLIPPKGEWPRAKPGWSSLMLPLHSHSPFPASFLRPTQAWNWN